MKAIIASEAAALTIRDRLITDLSIALAKREAQIQSGDVTGMVMSPQHTVHFHVVSAFNALEQA